MTSKLDLNNPQYKYVQTYEDAKAAAISLLKEKMVAVDVETTGFNPYIDILLLTTIAKDGFAYIFDSREIKLSDLPEFREVLESKSIIKIFQNGKFDYKFIKKQLGIEINNMYDTMLSEGVLTAGIGAPMSSLAYLCKKYLDYTMSKEARDTFMSMTPSSRFTHEQLIYAALDTLVLFPIVEKQMTLLQKEAVLNIAKLEFATTKVVAEMELRGIYINVDKWKGIIESLKEKRDSSLNELFDLISPYYGARQEDLFGTLQPPINMNSQQQLMDLFNKKLKIEIASTGDEVLSKIDHPVAKALRKYRGYEKLISAFGDSLLAKINPATGKLHPDFNQLGAATGRFSCNNPNLQQIPRNTEDAPFRECFNPTPGYKLVVADYSAFEMRILADLSGDEKMIEALKNDLDIHSYTAALMFNKEYTKDFKKLYPELRQIAKPIGFGLMYGMGAVGLANRLQDEIGREVTQEEGQEYMDKYFSSYPSVQKFLDKMAKDAVRNGWSSTPAGRKRWYEKPDPTDPEYRRKVSSIQRQAKNHPIQGTNADAIKYALVFIHERMKKEGIDGGITHTVHDEIVTEVREDQAQAWSLIQAEEMGRAANLFIKKVPVKSDPFVGDVWEH